MTKFHPGQHVMVRPNPSFAGRAGVYRIVKALPFEGGPQKYRIKSEREAFDRIHSESGLDAID